MEVYGDGMQRPRARVARTAVTGVALAVLLSGCGSNDAAEDDGPDQKTAACRDEWKDLGKNVQGNDQKTNPSALAARWNNVVATVGYYASSAKASDCGEAITKQKAAISALTSFSTRLAPYDMELRLDQVRDQAQKYAEGPPPPSPSPSPKNKKKPNKLVKPPPAPPSPAQVAAALKTLTAQAPVATQQQGPGWTQARVVELTDTAAVAKTVKDLAFLSTESPSYRACQLLLARIRTALAG